MKSAASARELLRANRLPAAVAEGICLAVYLLLPMAEWLLLQQLSPVVFHLFGSGRQTEELLTASALLLFLLLDLLLVSPLRAGLAAFYREMDGERSSPTALVRFYRRGRYGRAVQWRLALWLRRLLFGVPCLLPSLLLFGMGDGLLRQGLVSAEEQLIYLLLLISGLFFLLIGLLVLQLCMLRYMPAQYLLEESGSAREAIRDARRLMKGRTEETAALYLRFVRWLPACLLGVPYFYAAPLFRLTRSQWVAHQQKV